jgi:dynein heavy chain
LVFLTGQINYGGRVTDDIDRRCLLSILDFFVSEKAAEEKYSYSASGIYYPPKDGTLQDYREYI